MRPVKTVVRDGRPLVLTKTVNGVRRVSCSCCEEDDGECCLYPADEFGFGYGSIDLPNSVLAPINADQLGIYTRDGSRFVGTFTSDFSVPLDDPTVPTEVVIATLFGFTGWTWRAQGGPVTEGVFPCLFGQDDLPVFDNFANTYAANILDVEIPMTRVSLCRWQNSNFLSGNAVWNFSVTYNQTELKWLSRGARFDTSTQSTLRFRAFKAGNQNTPAGAYSDDQASWTITEE
jgi:hypothetical protein